MAGLTDDQLDALKQLALPARENKILSPKVTEKLILDLSKEHWLTRKQIGILMNRNPDSLTTRFLTSMLGHNLLKLKYPDRLNRPDQAYKTNRSNPYTLDYKVRARYSLDKVQLPDA